MNKLQDKRWVLNPDPEKDMVQRMQENLKKDGRLFSEPLSKLLVQRGVAVEEAKSFFCPSLMDLHDPFGMRDMEMAVERLSEAVGNQEKVMVFGDYDVDGTTAVALVVTFLRSLGMDPDHYIPDRYEEGYGVSFKGVDTALEAGASLMIVLDCGIKAHEKVEYANANGLDVIICDHHTPGDTLPPAHAVLDPKREDDDYPFEGLSGCGVGFKLIHGFAIQQDIGFEHLTSYLDLLAISIAADIVPVTDENRILMHFGLQRINEQPRSGIKGMLEAANVKKQEMTVTDLVFVIGPRINAAGRMKSGKEAVDLLISEDDEEVRIQGNALNSHNQERKGLDKEITKEALRMIEEDENKLNAYTTVLHDPSWHKGVIGIVASRLQESYHRPTIVMTGGDGVVTGSARSVKGFDIYQAIDQCSDLLERFGGHKFAAGLTLDEKHLPEFKERFESIVAQNIDPDRLVPELNLDLELSFQMITPRFFKTLQRFGPFGPGNMKPVFLTREVIAEEVKSVGKGREHLKLDLRQKDDSGSVFSAIAFGFGHLMPDIIEKEVFHIAYHIEENEFRGRKSIQLNIKDIKFGDPDEAIRVMSLEKESSKSQ